MQYLTAFHAIRSITEEISVLNALEYFTRENESNTN